jgi:quercetin dioxygenase-like cupin family protein
LREAGELSVALAMGAPGGGPRPELRAKLMERIRRERGAGLGAVLSTEGAWRETGIAGVSLKPLYLDQASGLMTMLVRMQPGAIYPAHTHSRTEQCLVLEGDLRHGDHVYGPGDFTWAEAGSVDPALHTVQGNLLLIIAAAENRV